jgi:FkbM family methyltransferase
MALKGVAQKIVRRFTASTEVADGLRHVTESTYRLNHEVATGRAESARHSEQIAKDAWAASQLRHEFLLNRLDQLHIAAMDTWQPGLDATRAGIDATRAGVDATRAGIDAALAGVDSTRSDLAIHGTALARLEARVEQLVQIVIDNHAVTWESDRVLSSTTLERFAKLERHVRHQSNAPGVGRVLGDPVELQSETRRIVAARQSHAVESAAIAMVAVDGLSVAFPSDDTVMLPYIREHGTWEPHVARALVEHCAEGDVVIDIGAHVGVFTCLLGRTVGASGTVIAVEPDQRNAQLLRNNLVINSVANAVVVEAAVGTEAGVVQLFRSPFGNSGDIRVGGWDESGEEFSVLSVKLDELVPPTVRVSVIKIDVQGLDFAVLRSGAELLRRDLPVLVAEVTPDLLRERGDDPHAFTAWLDELGYDVAVLKRDDDVTCKSTADVVAAAEASPLGYVDVLCRPRKSPPHR